jgi:hypothetical protein
MKKKVLVIGSGLRAQSALLPALWCLQDTHELIGVYGRTRKKISTMEGRFRIEVTDSLADVSVDSADIIMVAVTKERVPDVLRDLSIYTTQKAILMLDTPVLPLTNIFAARFFKRFKKVLVSEDTIALPPHLLARTLIENECIGKVKSIYFFHNGYKYHAVASLKMLSASKRTGTIIGRKFYNGIMQKEFFFPNGVRGLLYEPRDYQHSKFLIKGEKGYIADYDFSGKNLQARIGYTQDGELYTGMTLDGTIVADTELHKNYLQYMTHDVLDLSLMNSMKIRGLMDLIAAATEQQSSLHYLPFEGVLDNLLMISADKLGFALDPRF